MTTKPSPFNGRWGLTYSSDFGDYMDAFGITDQAFRQRVNESLSQYEGDDRLFENYVIENDTVTRRVEYKGQVMREGKGQPFDTIVSSLYFDGRPVEYYFGREDGRDDFIVRFEIGNEKKVHCVVQTEVYGPKQDQMLSTYFCRGKQFIKKWVKVA